MGTRALNTAQPRTPSEWFSKMFANKAKKFGCPFIELLESRMDGLTKINPLAPNLDFLAAILGGDETLGHKIIYLEGEMEFYYYDPRAKLFQPVSEAKLGNLRRALLLRCAEELPDSVHKLNLFLEFRSDKTIRAVVQRAKSILAADQSFFGVDSRNRREKGLEMHERVARVFVEQVLERQEGNVLTLTNAFRAFNEFLQVKNVIPVKRVVFKRMLAPVVRDVFDLGLRHDLEKAETTRRIDGWKGMRCAAFLGAAQGGLAD